MTNKISDAVDAPIKSTNPTVIRDNQIETIAAKLRAVIDELGKNFADAKNLILELARLLDETKQCEQSQICRKIKEILKDKIKESKISEKWIEECLPQEYKRKYVKSEVSSLSDDNDIKAEKILIDNSGRSSAADSILSTDGSDSNNNTAGVDPKFTAGKSDHNITSPLKNQELSCETDCPRRLELEEALLRASCPTPADKTQNDSITYWIHKEKHGLLIAALKNSQQFCSVIFDKNGMLVHAEPDLSVEMGND